MSIGFGKAASTEPPGSQQHQIDREIVPGENHPAERQAREANRSSNDFVEDCRLQLDREEVGIVRIQGGVQVTLDGGKIYAIIFGSGMVSGNEQAESGENRQNQGVPEYGIVFQALRS